MSLEQLAVLGAGDRLARGADQLAAERVEHPGLVERLGEVERRLAAHRRQQRVGPLAPSTARTAGEVERLEVGAVGEPRGRS